MNTLIIFDAILCIILMRKFSQNTPDEKMHNLWNFGGLNPRGSSEQLQVDWNPSFINTYHALLLISKKKEEILDAHQQKSNIRKVLISKILISSIVHYNQFNILQVPIS